jgi:tetraacyldisaccharide 4'-kinase
MKRAKRLKTKGIYFLYRVLQACGLPVLLFYFLFRGLRSRGYLVSLPQRFGFLPRSFRQTGPGAIWLHAVSVGEIMGCIELLRRLRAEFPQTRLLVSTSTVAGRAAAGQKLSALADGIFYAPVDYLFAVRRVFRALQPSLVVVMETEIWPNLFAEAGRTGAALLMVNGRISDRAFPRYRPWRWFFGAVLPLADSILAQTEPIRRRFLALGALPGRVRVGGNFKYDFEPRAAPPASPVPQFVDSRRPARVWIAASTMPPAQPGDPDEDDAVIAAWRQLSARHPDLVLLLAPRRPERFAAAAEKLRAAGIGFVRRSELAGTGRQAGPAERVLLIDTIGELSGLFSLADVVFMGGTLARRGGHNILEPAWFRAPVVVGPHMENFQAIAEDFRAAGALVEIGSALELASAVDRLLSDPPAARALGDRALACAAARRGATARALAEIRALYRSHLPCHRPPMPWFALAWALSRAWEAGGRRRCEAALREQRKVDAPVVSVGNLTMGGTGKTPCVLLLAGRLKERGYFPGILTRGYKRASPEAHLELAPGEAMGALLSGDEPQIFIRSGLAAVGIGADRYRSAMELRHRFGTDLLLLDDGFQHARLARDVDIVLIDAISPFGGGYVFPLGRLREPAASLARASVVVITRSRLSGLAPAIEEAVRRYNPQAPIFRASLEAEAWVENRSGRCLDASRPPFTRAAAFCGLGNPQSFRRTLERMGLPPVDWLEFDDHHRYLPRELRRMAHHFLAAGADALVTTEKDAVNLCDMGDDLLAPLPLYWLKVRMTVENEDAFVDEIERRIC